MQNLIVNLPEIKNICCQKDPLISPETKNIFLLSKTPDSNNSKKNFFCEKCKKNFSTQGNLQTHIKNIHENNRPFKCTFPNCTKAYVCLGKLYVHERTHTGLKPFVCQICQKSFNEKGNLKSHLKFHSEIRPFKCSLCDKRYKTNGHLKDHIDIEHYKIKKFNCQICNKNFGRISALKTHIRKHTEIKRFECQFPGCGKRFTEKRNMENHYARHLKKLNQKVKNIRVKKTYGPKKVEEDFEEKIKIVLSQLDNMDDKKKKIKEKQKNENKTNISSTEKKENLSQNCFNISKYSDKSNLNNFNNAHLGNYSDSSNNIPLMTNSRKINDEENKLKNVKISDNNYIIINNITNNYTNYNYIMNNNNNNFGIFMQHLSDRGNTSDNNLYLNNQYSNLGVNNNV